MKKLSFAATTILCVALSACSTPDVTKELASFATELEETGKSLSKTIDPKATEERNAAKKQAIRQAHPVYKYPKGCISLATINLDRARPRSCKLEPQFAPTDEKGRAVFAQEAWRVIIAYEAALQSLATSTSPASIGENLAELLTQSNILKQTLEKSSDIVVISEADIKSVGKLASGLADAARGRAIRTLVQDAHLPLKTTIAELISFLSHKDGVARAGEDLTAKHSAMQGARIALQRNPGSYAMDAQYGAAVKNYETSFKKFNAVYAKSDAAKLIKLWNAQKSLFLAVQQDEDPDAVLTILESIKALTE